MSINRQIQFVRGNTQCINQYTGPIGSLAINTDNYNIHVQDGVTPGGYVVSGGGTTYGNSNVAAYLIANGYLTSATANLNIYAWNANLSTYAWNANVNNVISSLSNYALNANVSNYGNTNVRSYLGAFDGNVVPSANSIYSLGSITNQWRDLFVSNNTIYINGIPLSINASNNLTVNGNVVGAGTNYSNANVASYLPTYSGDIAANISKAGYSWTFGTDGNLVLPLGGYLGNVWGEPSETTLAAAPGGFVAIANSSGDQYVDANDNNVQIGTNYRSGVANVWLFYQNGWLVFPDGAIIDNGFFKAASNSSVNLLSNNEHNQIRVDNANVEIYTSPNGSTQYQWTFSQVGNLTSPTGAGINNGYPGDTIGDGQGWFVTPSGNGGGVASADGQQYVQVNNGYGVEIGTGWPGNAHAWHFGLNGNLTLPTNTAAINYANGVSILSGLGGGGSNYSNVNVQAFANLSNYAYNANVTAANLGMQGYVDQANTIQSNQISTANVGMQGYVNLANSIQSAQITNLANNMYTNANVQAYSVVWTSDLRPSANATYNLGNTTNQWNSITANALAINSGTISGLSIGYRDIPQVTLSSNVSITTSDAGKHYYSTVSANPQTLTIANNASQAFSIGATINVINGGTANIIITQGSGVTLYLAGNATASNRTLSSYGMATITKVATNTWYCVGVGLA